MINVSVLGANGYTGYELIKILLRHPEVKIKYLACRKESGMEITSVFPSLTTLKGVKFHDAEDIQTIASQSDAVFCCLPHGASAEIISKIAEYNTKIIDLSADFRYTNLKTYQTIYKIDHPAKELAQEAVYGMVELNRDKIAQCRIAGNPGCYTTSAIIPLAPLIKSKIITPKGIIVDAKSGVSGAGKKSDFDFSFSEVNENFKAYAVTTHRHTSEIEEALSNYSGADVTVSFTPHLLPITRGILSTIYAPLEEKEKNAKDLSAEDIAECYSKHYGNERFINVLGEGIMPEIKHAVNTNNIHIGYKIDTRLRQIIIVSVLDNLVKGASGQAVQNMNVMCGFPEHYGLEI